MTKPERSFELTPTTLAKWLVVIPARLKSERLPRKPLADLCGKPLIVRVYENLAPLSEWGAKLVVAVDHDETKDVCVKAGIPCIMTKESHQSGTDRCNEAVSGASRSYVLNVQGDEPFVDLYDLVQLMREMELSSHPMGTLGIQQSDWHDFQNPNVVKIVMGIDQSAIYFSRAPVPFDRDANRSHSEICKFIKHIGVYAFRRQNLKEFCQFPVSLLEQTEKLEQLRAISNGWKIFVSMAHNPSIGIDTAEDLEIARERFRG